MKIVCIGNYPPRKCGIATFTQNLVKSITGAAGMNGVPIEIEIAAMNEQGKTYAYPDQVKLKINDLETGEYRSAADYINNSGADACLFQHEYGIFGGHSGLLALQLLQNIDLPVISTFHTVLRQPGFHQKEVLKKIAAYSSHVVVMSRLAVDFLTSVFEVPAGKISIIEHGIPNFQNADIDNGAIPDKWKNRRIMLTFGLLGRNKGIETVIRALPAIVEKHPDMLYVVLGKTHPHVVQHAGEEYRNSLHELVKELKLENHVEFIDRYVTENELIDFLRRADVYVTPYLNEAQITSGTLAYAVGGGSAVFSTPYWHACELLDQDRGILFGFSDHEDLSEKVIGLLAQPERVNQLKQNAREYGLTIAWPKIGERYLRLIENTVKQFAREKNTNPNQGKQFPDFDPTHLYRLTDDTGIVQHARSCIPNYKSGYCLDDNARALIVALQAWHKFEDTKYLKLIDRFLAYLMYMQGKDGMFKNYLSYSKDFTEIRGSDDAFGRAVWALGVLVRYAPNDALEDLAIDMLYKSLPMFDNLHYARGYANCIFGIYNYLKKYPDQEAYVSILESLANGLCQKFDQHSRENWKWFESQFTYDNGLLPAALFLAYHHLKKDKYLDIADQTRLELEYKSFENNHLKVISTDRWLHPEQQISTFAQQPVDALAMILMYDAAWQAQHKQEFTDKVITCFMWFLGYNDLDLPLYDETTKGCNDGLEKLNVNRNQGAESIVSWLMSWLAAEPYFSGSRNKNNSCT